jgi:hypothetical protein
MQKLNYLIIYILFVFCQQVQQIIGVSRASNVLISSPITLTANDSRIMQHTELPEVTNEVSITLWLNIAVHDPKWACVFHKGITTSYVICELPRKVKLIVNLFINIHFHQGDYNTVRTPSLWLTPSKSAPHARFSVKDYFNVGINSVGSGLLLNRWYHLAYTLSDSEKKLEFYIDGELADLLPTKQIVFNVAPLYIGYDNIYNGITGQIRYGLLS